MALIQADIKSRKIKLQGVVIEQCTYCEEDIVDKCGHAVLCPNCDLQHRLCCLCYGDLIETGQIQDFDMEMDEMHPSMVEKWK